MALTINRLAIHPELRDKILARFPKQYYNKLDRYTGEELYYVYCLAKYNPPKDKASVFYLALKAKLYRWLRDELCDCHKPRLCLHRQAPKSLADLSCTCESVTVECKHGISGDAWAKLAGKFKYKFEEFTIEHSELVFED